jgi:hypothetical protein
MHTNINTGSTREPISPEKCFLTPDAEGRAVIPTNAIAQWYLRINGFLRTANFVVHPDVGRGQLGEIDVIGVRFPQRAENEVAPMQDDAVFNGYRVPLIVIAETKPDRVRFNKPFSTSRRQGAVSRPAGHRSARCFGSRSSGSVAANDGRLRLCDDIRSTPRDWSPSKSHDHLRPTERYSKNMERGADVYIRAYEDEKALHDQWDECGKTLWRAAYKRDGSEFVKTIRGDWSGRQGNT